ncbi:MAG: 4-alpha-glucanotransferase [Nitrospiraceae bacterium]|nr:MAG: 4-alpha-glucanotransferase [Nitrospiraceae bacterium]
MDKRSSGILLHITSLPSQYGIGDFGPEAYRFADFLVESRQRFWQILPLNLTCTEYGNSPYSSFSAFAGNHLLISPDRLVRDGFLLESDIQSPPAFPLEKVDYQAVTGYKEDIFSLAYRKNRDKLAGHQDFQEFCGEHSHWLDNYSLFISLKNNLGGIEWGRWPEELRDRKAGALREWSEKLQEEILREKFMQYIFFTQWSSFKTYCDSINIRIFGDIPIYVNYDSADVWANPKIFSLDHEKRPAFVSGVPPDYFSSTGQLWGHPVYHWEVLKKHDYSWWVRRIEHNLKLYHLFRIDHFRGFVGYWEVPAGEKTAINGKWVKAPAEDFFKTILKHFPNISIVAEDLGVITDDVREIMNKFGFPGMKVLLFAFSEDLPANPYAPHNHVKNCVVYTGTHDNNTVKGWFKKELDHEGRKRLFEYLGREVTDKTVHWEVIRLAMMSVAGIIIVPMQDVLGLGEKDRMNLPASPSGNWEWRMLPDQLSPALSKKLSEMTRIYGRGY